MRDPTADQQSETTRVARCIEEDIIFGRIEPGAALREERLLARFGVSRHIVRAALALLEHDGIVIRELNRGARVRTFSATEVKELHEVREVLQRHAALRIRLPVEQSEIEKLEEIESRYETAVETGDLRGMQDINSEFHRGVFALCGNAHLCNMIARRAWRRPDRYDCGAASSAVPMRRTSERCSCWRTTAHSRSCMAVSSGASCAIASAKLLTKRQ